MRILLISTLLLGSLATACQNSDLSSTPQTGDTPITENTIDTPAPSSVQTSQSASSGGRPVAASPNNAASSQRACSIGAYVIDKDPQGLNVRSGPGNSYNVIDKLATTTAGVIVDLTASQGDWVQLTKAESSEGMEFQGTGWVYARLLGTSTRGYGTEGVSVYSSPSTQSSVLGRIPPSTSVTLLGCDRSWALVEYQGLKGWLEPESQCGNPFTTCS